MTRTLRTPKKEQARIAAEQAARREAEQAARVLKQARFLDAFRGSANVRAACQAANIGRTTIYAWRDADTAFAAAWLEAEDEATELLEAHAWSRATKGTTREHATYYNGKAIGTEIVTEYSDTLLIFLLKARRPKVYRETIRQEHTGADGGPIEMSDGTLTDSGRADRIAGLLDAARARRDGRAAASPLDALTGAADGGVAQ